MLLVTAILAVLLSHPAASLSLGDPLPPACDLAAVCAAPDACPAFTEDPPPEYDVLFRTNVGRFTVHVTTAWAPPFAKRFWALSRLRYMEGARFYRVASHDFSDNAARRDPFVVQFGYRGVPAVDNCWDADLTSLEPGGPVVPPGNQRGYVSFSMGSQPNKTEQTPYCSDTARYCAIGFSNNIFINLGNNTKLDAPGFSVFGRIDDAGMRAVDRIWKWYGEVTSLCGANTTDVFCRGRGDACRGVNDTAMLLPGVGGTPYLKANFPKLSYIRYVVTTVPSTRG